LNPAKKRVSLGWIDRETAEAKAREMAGAFEALGTPEPEVMSLGRLFDIYNVEVTPTKSVGKQKHDRACMELFSRFFLGELEGEDRHRAAAALRRRGRKGVRWADACPVLPAAIGYRQWQRFERERESGKIAPPRARKVLVGGMRRNPPVGKRQVQYDLQFLRALLSWAAIAGLIDRNPVAGFKLPRNPSPAQPLLFEEEYRRMLDAVPQMPARKRRRGTHEAVPTRPELVRRRLQLVLLNESGHRGQSVLYLRWSDFDLAGERVRWDARYDKQRKEHWTALSPQAVTEVRSARAELGVIGDAWVFPSPVAATKPMSRSAFGDWFRQAAKLAGVSRKRVGTHSMRRKAATEFGGEDPAVAAAALGMSVITYLTIYKQPTLDHQREAQAARKPVRADRAPG
jgi:integrase